MALEIYCVKCKAKTDSTKRVSPGAWTSRDELTQAAADMLGRSIRRPEVRFLRDLLREVQGEDRLDQRGVGHDEEWPASRQGSVRGMRRWQVPYRRDASGDELSQCGPAAVK